ncbi:MAG: CDF family Co(II)/Ni(II) efflux transporter DmeF [Deltaproteobacteria bacterium]|nr:CDF family Co(II)/Ni(II) efflux transporter DmeF [Deltaproteobacteria bacterium]
MHIHSLHKWKHAHDFTIFNRLGERKTKQVIALTASTMVIEIAAGLVYGSMALLADGWHMGTHVAALGITVFAYRYARRHADNPYYSFGTGKVSVIGGYASAIALAVVALLMAVESILRLISPQAIQFNEAIAVAFVGLGVNLVSAFILHGHHQRDHEYRANNAHPGHDHNLRAAYLHVLADTLTSMLAIIALLTGKAFGWIWMDATMGIVGAVVISRWSYGLLRDTAEILLDGAVDPETVSAIRSAIESDADTRVADLHVWQVGPDHVAAIISVVTHYPRSPKHYKEIVSRFGDISHVTVEVNQAQGESCLLTQSMRVP